MHQYKKAYITQFTVKILLYDKIGNYTSSKCIFYLCMTLVHNITCVCMCLHIVLQFIGICSQCILLIRLLICTVKCLYESNETAHLRKLTQSSIIPNLLLKFTASFLYYPTLHVTYVCVFSLKMVYQLHTIAFYCYSSSYRIITYFSYVKRKQLTIFASSSF